MIMYYKTIEEELKELEQFEEGAWVNAVNPTEEEILQICDMLHIEQEFVRPALDEEERSRIEAENGATMILVDIPMVVVEGKRNVYSTLPLGIVLTRDAILTVCLRDNPILGDFIVKRIRNFFTQFKSRFVLQILYKNATFYLYYLRHIEKITTKIENDLQQSTKNKELTQLLKLEKSLVYFSTSLKSNEIVLEKMMKLEHVKKYPEDQELLEDVIIENRQAIEMTNIHSSILSGLMDAFASIISNNLNVTMKNLTNITIAISIPTMVASFFGMNVPNPFEDTPWAFPLILVGSVALTAGMMYWLLRRKLF